MQTMQLIDNPATPQTVLTDEGHALVIDELQQEHIQHAPKRIKIVFNILSIYSIIKIQRK